MPTFILKKYEEEKPVTTDLPEGEVSAGEKTEPKVAKELTVDVSGSISEIVARALNKVLVNTSIELKENVDESENADATIKAISSEDINSDPVSALRSVGKADVLLITSEGFNTSKEEWFLTNVENNVGKVFYSVESFIAHIVSEFSNV